MDEIDYVQVHAVVNSLLTCTNENKGATNHTHPQTDRIWMMMMLPAKTCNNLAMTIPLSSSIISPKASGTVSSNPYVSRRHCSFTTRSLILLNRISSKSVQPKLINCIFSKLDQSAVSMSSTYTNTVIDL